MAQNTRLTPYDEQSVGTFADDASGPEFMAYGSGASMATEGYSLPEDPMPLFLSNDAEEPGRRGFGTGKEINWNGAVIWPRLLKAGIFAVSAAAIAFVILPVENPLALFANARASLIGSSAAPSGATQKSAREPVAAVQLASNGPPGPVMPSTAGIRALPPPARVTPTRDDIALALRAAHQSQTETAQPPAAAAPARRLDADELAALLKRAKNLIAIGDIAPARLLLERAADAQEASAALLLAQTYDPAVLGTPDLRSITPDPAMARDWYQKAARLGSLDARQRLAQMQN
jgi:hypothetical protein